MQLEDWTVQNKLQLQVPKCKELLFQFTTVRSPFPSVVLSSGILELVDHAKVLGLTISNDLKWSKHVAEMIKKVNKRKYFIIQLKRAKVPAKEIINFYCTCVRPVLEYSCEVFHFALPTYLSDAIEQVQRRVTSIIFPGLPYSERCKNATLLPSVIGDTRPAQNYSINSSTIHIINYHPFCQNVTLRTTISENLESFIFQR